MYKVERLEVGQLKANCYIVANNEQAVVVDPGDDAEYIINKIRDLDVSPVATVATHGHFDHVMAAAEVKLAYNIPFIASRDDVFLLERVPETAKHFLKIEAPPAPAPDFEVKEGSDISFENIEFEILAISGHSPGSVAYYNKKEAIVFSGDLVFADGLVGRTDLSYSNKEELKRSIIKLLQLPGKTIVYPGHGERTTINELKTIFDKQLGG